MGLSGHCTSNRHHHRAAVPLGFAPSPLPPPTGAAALLPRARVSGYEGSTQRFVLLLSFSFSFRSEIGLCRPVVHRHIIVDTPEYEVVVASSQSTAPTLVIKPPLLVSPHFQVVAPPMLLSSSWLSIQVRTYCSKFTDTAADVDEGRRFALFSCTVYDRHPRLIVLLNSSARSY